MREISYIIAALIILGLIYYAAMTGLPLSQGAPH